MMVNRDRLEIVNGHEQSIPLRDLIYVKTERE